MAEQAQVGTLSLRFPKGQGSAVLKVPYGLDKKDSAFLPKALEELREKLRSGFEAGGRAPTRRAGSDLFFPSYRAPVGTSETSEPVSTVSGTVGRSRGEANLTFVIPVVEALDTEAYEQIFRVAVDWVGMHDFTILPSALMGTVSTSVAYETWRHYQP